MNILIINDTDCKINYDSLEKGCGGSETWALQLGNAFVQRNNLTILCTNTNEKNEERQLYKDKLNIIPLEYLSNIIDSIDIDFVIVSRILSEYVQNILRLNYKKIKYIFYQFHDLYPLENNYKENLEIVNKVVALTPYHAKYMHVMSDSDYSKFIIIPNGIDPNLFNGLKESEIRDNRMLWCSNPDRGLYIILKYLYDDIKKEIPDFGIDIAYPNYSNFVDTQLITGKDVRNIGSLGKKELYNEMIKHKCWCYPQNFIDTFCISMLENVMCDINIVVPWWYAPNDIFGEFIGNNDRYKKLLEHNDEYSYQFYTDYINSPEFSKYIEWLKEKIIDAIKNYDSDKYKERRFLMKQKVIQNYTWDRVAQMYENLFINEIVQKGNI